MESITSTTLANATELMQESMQAIHKVSENVASGDMNMLAEDMVQLSQAEVMTDIAVKIAQVYDDMIGSLLDIKA